MVVNTIIGTGGDMSQIYRTALNEKIESKHVNLIGVNVPVILEDTLDAVDAIILNNDLTNIIVIDAPTIENRTRFIDAIPIIRAPAEEVLHQYITLVSSGSALDMANNHIV